MCHDSQTATFFASRASAPWCHPPLDQMLRAINMMTERQTSAPGDT